MDKRKSIYDLLKITMRPNLGSLVLWGLNKWKGEREFVSNILEENTVDWMFLVQELFQMAVVMSMQSGFSEHYTEIKLNKYALT